MTSMNEDLIVLSDNELEAVQDVDLKELETKNEPETSKEASCGLVMFDFSCFIFYFLLNLPFLIPDSLGALQGL